jgi:hypothetical protein
MDSATRLRRKVFALLDGFGEVGSKSGKGFGSTTK